MSSAGSGSPFSCSIRAARIFRRRGAQCPQTARSTSRGSRGYHVAVFQDRDPATPSPAASMNPSSSSLSRQLWAARLAGAFNRRQLRNFSRRGLGSKITRVAGDTTRFGARRAAAAARRVADAWGCCGLGLRFVRGRPRRRAATAAKEPQKRRKERLHRRRQHLRQAVAGISRYGDYALVRSELTPCQLRRSALAPGAGLRPLSPVESEGCSAMSSRIAGCGKAPRSTCAWLWRWPTRPLMLARRASPTASESWASRLPKMPKLPIVKRWPAPSQTSTRPPSASASPKLAEPPAKSTEARAALRKLYIEHPLHLLADTAPRPAPRTGIPAPPFWPANT